MFFKAFFTKIALFLAIALCLTVFASCDNSQGKLSSANSEESSESVEETSAPVEVATESTEGSSETESQSAADSETDSETEPAVEVQYPPYFLDANLINNQACNLEKVKKRGVDTEDGVSFVRFKFGAASNNAIVFKNGASLETAQETGRYLIIKYRLNGNPSNSSIMQFVSAFAVSWGDSVEEKIGNTDKTYKIYTSPDGSYGGNMLSGTTFHNDTSLFDDGEWHILAVDLSANHSSDSTFRFFRASKDGKYYMRSLRIGVCPSNTSDTSIDLAYIGFSDNVSDFASLVSTTGDADICDHTNVDAANFTCYACGKCFKIDIYAEGEAQKENEADPNAAVWLLTPAENDRLTLVNKNLYDWATEFALINVYSQQYYNLHSELCLPKPVVFKWAAKDIADSYKLSISRNPDMSEAEEYLCDDTSLELYGLFTGTKYYWQVEAVYSDRVESSDILSFETAISPRTVKIDGVSNVRDIGGVAVSETQRIRQGLVYRGAWLNEITAEGKEYALKSLGFKTDLDLRNLAEIGSDPKSPLGADINYVYLDAPYYASGDKGVGNPEKQSILADEIRVFANPDNYPIYLHCSLGRDRTGTLAFILEGLLGVSESDLFRDYELSVFSVRGSYDAATVPLLRSNISSLYGYIRGIGQQESFKDCVEVFLKGIGITQEEIDSIREILLEDVE